MNQTTLGITSLLDEYLRAGDEVALMGYLAAHGGLPGPRGNLELADAWARAIEARAAAHGERLWELCLRLAGISAAEAPTNDPREYLAFCGVRGLGALGALLPALRGQALEHLRPSAADAR